MPALPHEIWLHITSFVPGEELKKLYSVNQIFLQVALNAKYREVKINWLGHTAIKLLERLKDPYIGQRVQEFSIGPTFIEQAVCVEKKQRSILGRTMSCLGLKRKYDGNSYCSMHRIQRILQATLPHLQNIREYSLCWDPQVCDFPCKSTGKEPNTITHEVNLSDDQRLQYLCELLSLSTIDRTAPNYHYYFLGMNAPLPDADWRKRSIGKFLRRLPISLSPQLNNLRSLNISLTSRGIWSGDALFKGWNEASLSQLLSFVNGLAPTLETLSICPPVYYDLTPFFTGLGHFPYLRNLRIDEPIDRAHMSDVSVLHKFINAHSYTLEKLALGPSLTCSLLENETDVAWVPPVFSGITSLNIDSLHLGLLHHTDATQPVFDSIKSFSSGLRSFRIYGKVLRYDDVSSLAMALSAGDPKAPLPLRDLSICIDDLDKHIVDLLAAQFPMLTSLSILIDINCTVIRTGLFAQKMRGVRYPNWGLTDISVEIEKGRNPRLDHSIMEILAISTPSIKRFNGSAVTPSTLEGSEFTTFQLVE